MDPSPPAPQSAAPAAPGTTSSTTTTTTSSTSTPVGTTTTSSSAASTTGEHTPDLSELLRSVVATTTIEPIGAETTPATATDRSFLPGDDGATGPVSRRPLPVAVPASISRSFGVLGVPTHVFCQVFADRIVVGVTQLRAKHRQATKAPERTTTTTTAAATTTTAATPKSHSSSSGHIGSWVYCVASKSPIDPRRVDYELTTLLGGGGGRGSERDEKEIYARRISERLLEKKSIPGGTDRIVLLLGISLLPLPRARATARAATNDNDNNNDATTTATTTGSSIDRFRVLVEVLVGLVEEALGIALGTTGTKE